MLIRITNRCDARCRHCFIEGAGPDGKHMDRPTFEAALGFARALREPLVLLSGGEPTNHPELELFVAMAKRAAPETVIASNGMFALEERRRREVFALLSDEVTLQVTCDPRYYKRNLGLVQHIFEAPHVEFRGGIDVLQRCRRSDEARLVPTKRRPSCANLRMGVRQVGSLPGALAMVRFELMRRGSAVALVCTPSVDVDGTIRAGETDTCAAVGNVVLDDMARIEQYLLEADCDRCGTSVNLTAQQHALMFPSSGS